MGFIGSNLIRQLNKTNKFNIINIDKITYASDKTTLNNLKKNYIFKRIDINDKDKIKKIFQKYKPSCIFHLAAETHVDKSIEAPSNFLSTNVIGTFNLLNLSFNYWKKLQPKFKNKFKFIHVSTDEVYGDLGNTKYKFKEDSKYQPNSPYSASKASSDHFARSWNKTYGLPVIITNCSNNYGPFQFPEKFIPLTIMNAIKGKKIRIYKDGNQIRDWIHVNDHVSALIKIMQKGIIGQTYNIGTGTPTKNFELVKMICRILNELVEFNPKQIKKFQELIIFVKDRPGHDIKYLIDPTKIKRELKWKQKITLKSGLKSTVKWYLKNISWIKKIERKSRYSYRRYGLIK